MEIGNSRQGRWSSTTATAEDAGRSEKCSRRSGSREAPQRLAEGRRDAPWLLLQRWTSPRGLRPGLWAFAVEEIRPWLLVRHGCEARGDGLLCCACVDSCWRSDEGGGSKDWCVAEEKKREVGRLRRGRKKD